ncbi:hypothetical protein [Thiomonas sp. FB-6]|uniref:hypothetical protein n=1 Tax=Thiomonas sp. FB-6 TaxID=1158291 RepID=UPI000362E108|nr:hypothetical protein [Thiomonas sp. FB-6]
MPRSIVATFYVLAMIAAVVCVDVLLLRHQFWARLFVNIGIAAVAAATYLRFMKKP